MSDFEEFPWPTTLTDDEVYEVIARLHNAAVNVDITDRGWHYIAAFAARSEMFVTDYLQKRRAGVPNYQWIDPATLERREDDE